MEQLKLSETLTPEEYNQLRASVGWETLTPRQAPDGLAGSAFLGGAVFAYLTGLLPLMVILAVPGFLGWIAPYFCYQKIQRRRAEQTAPIIEQKNDEIYSVCEQGCRLLTA